MHASASAWPLWRVVTMFVTRECGYMLLSEESGLLGRLPTAIPRRTVVQIASPCHIDMPCPLCPMFHASSLRSHELPMFVWGCYTTVLGTTSTSSATLVRTGGSWEL